MKSNTSIEQEQKNKPKIFIRSAKDIYDTDYGEEQMLVDSLLPSTGLALLCGSFKCGKSFFIQLLGHCLTTQMDFLGKKINANCHCLYLALEDTERRLKKRFEKMAILPNDNLMISIKDWGQALNQFAIEFGKERVPF